MPRKTSAGKAGKGSHSRGQSSGSWVGGKGSSSSKEGGSWAGTGLTGGSKAKGACLPKALVLLLPFMTVITFILVKM